MTINIKKWRKVTNNTWHICGNNDCKNYVYGIMSVCLKCWLEHLASHGTEYSLLKQYNYDLESIKVVGKLSV